MTRCDDDGDDDDDEDHDDDIMIYFCNANFTDGVDDVAGGDDKFEAEVGKSVQAFSKLKLGSRTCCVAAAYFVKCMARQVTHEIGTAITNQLTSNRK